MKRAIKAAATNGDPMIDGHLHVYYVIEDDGRCEYQVGDESHGCGRKEGRIHVMGLPHQIGVIVESLIEDIVAAGSNMCIQRIIYTSGNWSRCLKMANHVGGHRYGVERPAKDI